MFRIIFAIEQPVFLLGGFGMFQCAVQGFAEFDCSVGADSLGGAEIPGRFLFFLSFLLQNFSYVNPVITFQDSLVDRQCSVFEINIIPSKTKGFADPESGVIADQEW